MIGQSQHLEGVLLYFKHRLWENIYVWCEIHPALHVRIFALFKCKSTSDQGSSRTKKVLINLDLILT